jgi:hypothetical protein
MNIFKSFLQSPVNQKESTTFAIPETTTIEAPKEIIPPFYLFIDKEAPQPEQRVNVEAQTVISLFLSKNYYSMGINDGYEYHSQATLEMAEKKIRAEFQLIVDQSIQNKTDKKLEIKIMVVNVRNISDETRENLELTLEELDAATALLQKQKELSAENEGWVMNPIHSYRQGFVRGLNDYISGERLLNSVKNL